jgi:hypothetical protein|tara:strand:- start:267 stop:746 length:480 start_codon:yes stop_codon:yes gene_type:complete
MADLKTFRSVLTGDFTVTARPEPIPGDLRVRWGQSLLIMVLASARGQRCSVQKVHFLAHVSRTGVLRDTTREVLARKRNSIALAIRIEPWVNRAAAFAKANGLVEVRDGKALALSDEGKAAAKTIRKEGLLADETAFLDEVGKFMTEQVVEKIMKMESI